MAVYFKSVRGLAPVYRPLIVAAVLLGTALLDISAVVTTGFVISAPAHHSVEAAPADLAAESVAFPSASGSLLQGWLVRGRPGRGIVILLHGVRSDRQSQVGRLRLLKKAGYTALAFDLQAHGESTGRHITFGHLEGMDAEASVKYVRENFPGERIAMIGQSLGGAATLLAPHPLPIDALVLESVFPDIDAALRNRLARFIGPASRPLTPLCCAFMPLVIGVGADELRPIDHIGKVRAPVLVLTGTADTSTTIEESRNLFAHAKTPKEFYSFGGAGHVDLLNYAPQEYANHTLPFLARYMRQQ